MARRIVLIIGLVGLLLSLAACGPIQYEETKKVEKPTFREPVSTSVPMSAPTPTPTPVLVKETPKTTGSPVAKSPTPETKAAKTGVPSGPEVFVLKKATINYRPGTETMIGVAADPPYKYGQKEVRFMVDNRTKENVLDGALFIDWKNYKGETITQAKKEFWRLFPGGSTETERFSYPEGATYYEVLVEAKKPEPISPSLVVKYNEDPLIKGGLLITYETAIQDKGTPRERWVAKINVKNTAPDKCFGEIALYFRPTDAAGNIVFEKESLGYGGPGLVTKEGFYLWKNPITILYSGKSESFQIFLPYEARKLEFYIQAEELPSQLTIEYISTVREVTLTDYKIQEWSGKVADYIVEKGFATHFNASDEGAHGLFWKVVITITTPVPRSFTSSERHTIHYIATDLTGKILYEGKTVIPPMGVEVSVEKWIWQETWFVSRNVAKLTLIERRLGE